MAVGLHVTIIYVLVFSGTQKSAELHGDTSIGEDVACTTPAFTWRGERLQADQRVCRRRLESALANSDPISTQLIS
jgi:hypothetical protein